MSLFLKTNKRKVLLCALTVLAVPYSHADEPKDPETRIRQLEQMVQKMQEQRAEQDKQLQSLTQELVAVQQQMAQGKEAKMAEKGKSNGTPAYVAFKDGVVLEDGSGNWALQFNGRIQADYRTIDPNQWKSDTFSVRRARLGGAFTFMKDFLVRVEGEYANISEGSKGTTGLTYGYLEYKHFPGARVRIGQFKPVFGLERAMSTNFIDFQELSMATSTGAIFLSTYDRGIMLFGAPYKGTYYNLSYVNGSGQNNDSLKDGKEMVARGVANIAEWADWKNAVVHVGASGSRTTYQPSTNSSTTTLALSNYTESNGITTGGTTGTAIATKYFSTAALDGTNIDKTRWGIETALAYGPVKLQGEFIRANYSGKTTANVAYDRDIDAAYADLNWMVTGENYADAYKDGMFGRILPKRNFSLDKEGFGAIELGVRYSRFDASSFVATGCTTGTGCLSSGFTNQADAWTAGAKWIVNPNARIVLNYVHTGFDTPVTINSKSSNDENAVTMRAQYDF